MTDKHVAEVRKQNQRILEEQHKMLTELEKDSAKTFDNAVLFLSAGALGLSLTFMKDFVTEPIYISFLYISWIRLVLALVIIFVSPLLSMKASQEQRRINQEYYTTIDDKEPQENRYSKWTWRTNLWSAVFLITGIIFLGFFVFNNYPQLNMSQEKNIKIHKGNAAESVAPPKPLLKASDTNTSKPNSGVIKSVVPPSPTPKITPPAPKGQGGGNKGGSK